MKIDDLQYSKGGRSRSLGGSPDLPIPEAGGEEVAGLTASSSDYSKGAPFLSTRIVFILSGGDKREKDYFRPLKRDEKIRSVRIAFRSKKGQGLKPFEMKRLAEEYMKTGRFITEDRITFNIEEGDKLYLLQDVDEFTKELKNYLGSTPDASSIQWIISNPSFEIWLFYHYYDNPAILSDGVNMSERDRSNWLKERLHKIIKGGVKTTRALYKAETAVINSRNNYFEETGFPGLYSTQMHLVAEVIVSAMGKEFAAMKCRQEESEAFYRQHLASRPSSNQKP